MNNDRQVYWSVLADLFPVECEDCDIYLGLGSTYFVHSSDPIECELHQASLCQECHKDRCANNTSLTEYNSWCDDAITEASKLLDQLWKRNA